MAGRGTLFLDEIGEISTALQVRLLRVLQERTYEPLGGTRSETAQARIIAATHKDLGARMQQGLFREDLYYRINVVRVELPPLRRRLENIPLLVDQFIDRFKRLQEKAVQGIAPEALSLLMAHRWPGNVRELENAVDRAFIMCTGERIDVPHLPEELRSGVSTPRRGEPIYERPTPCSMPRRSATPWPNTTTIVRPPHAPWASITPPLPSDEKAGHDLSETGRPLPPQRIVARPQPY